MSSDILTTSQPRPIAQPEVSSRGAALKERASRFAKKFMTRDGWLGDYDYGWCVFQFMCAIPRFNPPAGSVCLPCHTRNRNEPPPFYALDQDLPLILAISSGFQHSLAMLAGLITPPIIFASALSLDDELSAYMISASLIGCGK